VLPYVRERGVTEKMITEMLVEVPRRYFENVEAY
jgi:phosphotriesterase-related protein